MMPVFRIQLGEIINLIYLSSKVCNYIYKANQFYFIVWFKISVRTFSVFIKTSVFYDNMIRQGSYDKPAVIILLSTEKSIWKPVGIVGFKPIFDTGSLLSWVNILWEMFFLELSIFASPSIGRSKVDRAPPPVSVTDASTEVPQNKDMGSEMWH